MRNHVIALAGTQDALSVPEGAHIVPFDIPGHPMTVGSSVAHELARHDLTLSSVASDVMRFAVTAYATDMALSRKRTFDRWTREISLSLPVSNLDAWQSAHDVVVELLQFLTGDHWELTFRSLPDGYHPSTDKAKREFTTRGDVVCLFSGGLDSYIGALDLLAQDSPVILVGHHAKGTGATSGSQNASIDALRRQYDGALAPFLRFWVSPPKGPERVSETTTRGRSLLFLGLGVAVAQAAGAHRLVVPENGFISLNVPLTNSRLGTFSTRTTHPYFVALVRALFARIGLAVDVELPYRFCTKGEMVRSCANRSLLEASVAATMSCSHPESNRFRAHDPSAHCGRCVPCLIRRAALQGVRDDTKYVHANLNVPLAGKSGSDVRALRLALDRYAQHPPSIADVLSAGPLPGTDEERARYVDVFRRGTEEVRALLRRSGT